MLGKSECSIVLEPTWGVCVLDAVMRSTFIRIDVKRSESSWSSGLGSFIEVSVSKFASPCKWGSNRCRSYFKRCWTWVATADWWSMDGLLCPSPLCSLSELEFEVESEDRWDASESPGVSTISWSSMVVELAPRDWTNVESHNTGVGGVRVGAWGAEFVIEAFAVSRVASMRDLG